MALRAPPPLPPRRPRHFRATVHGTVFGGRTECVAHVQPGDELLLLPNAPHEDEPSVWVHAHGGDVLGHLPPEIEAWLSPWLLRGGRAQARAVRVLGPEAPSWNRLVLEVTCSA
ncbi:MAG: hypothetical protein WEB88_10575 [Gemmatimonadota bacterium]